MDHITLLEFLTSVSLLGGFLGIIMKFVVPALKITDRVRRLEKHEEENYKSNRLLCKALIALIDNRLTNNNIENLKNVKTELMDYITDSKTV